MYDGTMNATTKTTAAISLKDGDRIEVHLRGHYPDYFTLGSVKGFAEENGMDVAAEIARAVKNGHDLYYAWNEGITVTAHKQTPVDRTALHLGSLIEMDGQKFEIIRTPNYNIQLVPFATA